MNIKNINVKRLASLALMGVVLSFPTDSNRIVFDGVPVAYADTLENNNPNCIRVEKEVNVRTGPSKSCELYGITLPVNLVIEEYGHDDGWYKIKIGKDYFYVSDEFVSPCRRYNISDEVAVSDTDNLNIRALPSSDSRVSPSLGKLNNHESLKLLYTLDDWYAVSYKTQEKKEVTAFISREYSHQETEVEFVDSYSSMDQNVAEGVIIGEHTLACNDNKLKVVFGTIPKGTLVSVDRIGQDYLLVSYDVVDDKILNKTHRLTAYIKREDADITKTLDQGLKR